MTDALEPNEGLCPACGHKNLRTWVMCDNCGVRLPWAKPPRKASLEDLTDDQLAVVFGTSTPKKVPWVLTPEAVWFRWIILWPLVASCLASVIGLIVELIRWLFSR